MPPCCYASCNSVAILIYVNIILAFNKPSTANTARDGYESLRTNNNTKWLEKRIRGPTTEKATRTRRKRSWRGPTIVGARTTFVHRIVRTFDQQNARRAATAKTGHVVERRTDRNGEKGRAKRGRNTDSVAECLFRARHPCASPRNQNNQRRDDCVTDFLEVTSVGTASRGGLASSTSART